MRISPDFEPSRNDSSTKRSIPDRYKTRVLNAAGMAPAKTILCIALPRLSTDRAVRGLVAGSAAGGASSAKGAAGRLRHEPLALTVEERGARRIAAVSAAAERGGVWVGMTLSQGRAVLPSLWDLPHRPDEDRRELTALAAALGVLSPIVGIEGSDVLALDLTGCEAVSGAPRVAAARAIQIVGRRGYASRCAVASTLSAARALARFAVGREPLVVAPGGEAAALARLSPAALGLSEEATARIAALGIMTIEELWNLPRDPLAARLGAEVGRSLDRALGIAPEAITAIAEEFLPEERIEWPEPIDRPAAVEWALKRMADGLASQLEARGLGVSELAVVVERPAVTLDRPSAVVGGERRREQISVKLSEPRRSAAWLLTVLKARFERVDLGEGIEALAVRAARVQPLAYGAPAFFELSDDGPEDGDAREEWRELLDRFEARLGAGVFGAVELLDEARPERAWRIGVRQIEEKGGALPHLRPRPLAMVRTPVPVVLERDAAGEPTAITLGGERHPIVGAEGPERIETGWWDLSGSSVMSSMGVMSSKGAPSVGSSADRAVGDRSRRDYWVVELASGRRLWICSELTQEILAGVFS
ncbi:MAG: DNA polymerase Y family protein [Planctomycetes bacterium]|nr:DNA polymerase Y family protein [Planctomycetota bacterium]